MAGTMRQPPSLASASLASASAGGDAGALFAAAVAQLGRPRSATYRFQLGPALGFDQVAALAAYLDGLGVNDAYLSPCFKCGPGSSHGYDVIDHNAFNPEVGSPAGFDRMAATLEARGLGVILDIVPNHMGVAGDANPWWMDVLENGPSSPRADFFDIEWNPPKRELRDKVLLPLLPDQYGQVLEAGQLQLEIHDGAFLLRSGGARLPICPDSYSLILTHRLPELTSRLGADHAHLQELKSILTGLAHLPARTDTDPAHVDERLREKEVAKRRLAALLKESEAIREFIDDNVRTFNGTPGDPQSFDMLDSLLSEQTYRLADWRVAGDEINYRRFFDINDLAAIRMERPEVFTASHELVLRLVGEGKVAGLRVDHPDGLYAPGEYFLRLQEGAVVATARRLNPDLDPATALAVAAEYRAAAQADPGSAAARPLWIAAEKILLPDEPLPEWWPVAGTTGYDFLGSVNGLFVDRSTSRQMTATYSRFAGPAAPMSDLSYSAKRLIMQASMASEITQLGLHLDRISERNRLSRDFTLASLVRAIREVIAAFPVYRTYVGDLGDEPSGRDRGYIDRALADAKRRNPTVNVSIFDFLRDALLMRHPHRSDDHERAERRRFAMRFQQMTGPVTAKGVEDTALYMYNRLVSLNEVGGDPGRYGESVASFHEKNVRRRDRWPDSLTCTSTHDTKRGEDVRARISVLSEVPAAWAAHVRRWRMINRRFKRERDGRTAPDRNDEYLLYQTLVGAWPAREDDEPAETLVKRIADYMEKATKEAKRRTSWTNPDAEYDQALRDFVVKILSPGSMFRSAFAPFQRLVALHGAVNSLAQTVLKIAAPGIPDFYQGSELWDLALVDPDNRRPVDFVRRQTLLEDIRARIDESPADLTSLCAELLSSWPDGHVKMYVTHRGLTLRRELRVLFHSGSYDALAADGEHAEHIVALARHDDTEAVVAVVPRVAARLMRFAGEHPLGPAVWGDTRITVDLPGLGGVYTDRFSGRRIATELRDGIPTLSVGALLGSLPVALLRREHTP
jgi:(1->4)-alpha-D-glucan 1-alpha-D-glucosylmutase